ncbi:MAG TPA: class I SAM-dependent methyltransferase, partial [Xanthobacteraceae bacterium]|nr:class I SAM-dependent methyltransferase [Xanthobacteraceae bacterium]
MRDWIAFWNSKHSIYVNARHRDVHYRRIAEDVIPYIPPSATVIDFGCGEALHADLMASVAGRLILIDAAESVRNHLVDRFKDNPKIEVQSPDALSKFDDRSIDLIVMHSVAQYLTPAQLGALLIVFRRVLRPDGKLLLGDIIPPDVSAISDVWALLNFAARNG